MLLLEGDVVVGAAATEVVVARRRARRHELVAAPGHLAAAVAAAEELDALGDDLDRLPLRAVLRFPLAPLEAPVDRDGPALGEVLRAVLALPIPDGDVEVVGLLCPLAARAVLAARVHRDAEAADGGATGCVAKLGIARQVADEHDAIDVGHVSLRSSRSEGTQATPRSRRRPRRERTVPERPRGERRSEPERR